MVYNKKLICCVCKKKLKGHEKGKCDHCRSLYNIRRQRYRIKHKGILCRDCYHPISLESNGKYLTCINCRHLKNVRRI